METAMLRDKRAFLTGTYTPFKATTVRAYAEADHSWDTVFDRIFAVYEQVKRDHQEERRDGRWVR
ncbi:hypothetical protein EBR44_01225 [bacterium]|nr:hypothetical protein [bacterium]